MEYWSIGNIKIFFFSITPPLQYSTTPDLDASLGRLAIILKKEFISFKITFYYFCALSVCSVGPIKKRRNV